MICKVCNPSGASGEASSLHTIDVSSSGIELGESEIPRGAPKSLSLMDPFAP